MFTAPCPSSRGTVMDGAVQRPAAGGRRPGSGRAAAGRAAWRWRAGLGRSTAFVGVLSGGADGKSEACAEKRGRYGGCMGGGKGGRAGGGTATHEPHRRSGRASHRLGSQMSAQALPNDRSRHEACPVSRRALTSIAHSPPGPVLYNSLPCRPTCPIPTAVSDPSSPPPFTATNPRYHLPVLPTPTRDMPGHAYPKSQSFTAAYEPSPLLYKKASVPAIPAAPVPVSEEPKGSASPAHLLTKFIESHRALESFK